MFTGLIETVGVIRSLSLQNRKISDIEIQSEFLAGRLKNGDSVSVSGICLTVTDIKGCSFWVQVMRETMERTKLGGLRPGSEVNLERALSVDGRLDGHLVSGHIDEVGTVINLQPYGDAVECHISCSKDLLLGIAPKGSIAIDGVSLTVIRAGDTSFSVGLIPATLERTTLNKTFPGDSVNLEMDTIARYILRFFSAGQEMKKTLTWDKLMEYGWS